MTHTRVVCSQSRFTSVVRAVQVIVGAVLFVSASLPIVAAAESPRQLTPGTMAARAAACTQCHGADGQAGPDGFYPRIAGKPAGYLYAQLLSFRDGGRSYEPMRDLLQIGRAHV